MFGKDSTKIAKIMIWKMEDSYNKETHEDDNRPSNPTCYGDTILTGPLPLGVGVSP